MTNEKDFNELSLDVFFNEVEMLNLFPVTTVSLCSEVSVIKLFFICHC